MASPTQKTWNRRNARDAKKLKKRQAMLRRKNKKSSSVKKK